MYFLIFNYEGIQCSLYIWNSSLLRNVSSCCFFCVIFLIHSVSIPFFANPMPLKFYDSQILNFNSLKLAHVLSYRCSLKFLLNLIRVVASFKIQKKKPQKELKMHKNCHVFLKDYRKQGSM